MINHTFYFRTAAWLITVFLSLPVSAADMSVSQLAKESKTLETDQTSEKCALDGYGDLYSGKYNTEVILAALGDRAPAATKVNRFYAPGVDKNDPNFGQGNWYLPAIGELMYIYGTNVNAMDNDWGTSGATGDNKAVINKALATLQERYTVVRPECAEAFQKDKEGEAEGFISYPSHADRLDCTITTELDGRYWSSSEYNDDNAWNLGMHDGARDIEKKSYDFPVRAVNLMSLPDSAVLPRIGDVMYSDLSYFPAKDYDGTKTPVGIVIWVAKDGKSIKIINLKDATSDTIFNRTSWFEPLTNIAGLPDYDAGTLSNIAQHTESGKEKDADITAALYDGKHNTEVILAALGEGAPAATAVNKFYAPGVKKDDPNFGQGKWYLPAIGELADVFGDEVNNKEQLSRFRRCELLNPQVSYTNGTNKNMCDVGTQIINNALATLQENYPMPCNGCTVAAKLADSYWSSSEASGEKAWQLRINNGQLYDSAKDGHSKVRAFNLVDLPDNSTGAPNIGDVMYSDLSYGAAQDCEHTKMPVGIITWVAKDGKSVKIIALRDLSDSFSWLTSEINIPDLTDYDGNEALFDAVKSKDTADSQTFYGLYDGKHNTEVILAALGNSAPAVTAANLFYAPGVKKDDPNFGQGKWYIPAIGELMDVFGTDLDQIAQDKCLNNRKKNKEDHYKLRRIDFNEFAANPCRNNSSGSIGAIGNNLYAVNDALSTLQSRYESTGNTDTIAAKLSQQVYMSSSEYSSARVWTLDMGRGRREDNMKKSSDSVRVLNLVNLPDDRNSMPQIGDVMYSDLSYSGAKNYDGSKTPVGIIIWVAKDGKSAKIIGLRNLYAKNNVFDPDNPYKDDGSYFLWFNPNVDIKDIRNNTEDELMYAVRSADQPKNYLDIVSDLHNGKHNTEVLLAALGDSAQAATATNLFYAPGVDKDDPNFGQGKWYLPAMGELTDACSGANKKIINKALSALQTRQVASELTGGYLSSTESDTEHLWSFDVNKGHLTTGYKMSLDAISAYYDNDNDKVRCFNLVRLPDVSTVAPDIGDVMYSDLSYGAVKDYDDTKTPVGIITWVAKDGKSAKIINLQDLSQTDTFDPDAPYTGSNHGFSWISQFARIPELPRFGRNMLLEAAQSVDGCEGASKNVVKQKTNSDKKYDDIVFDETLVLPAVEQFYAPGVDKDDPNFGQGRWRLPFIMEEGMHICGSEMWNVTSYAYGNGDTGEIFGIINRSLTELQSRYVALGHKGTVAGILKIGYYWSSAFYGVVGRSYMCFADSERNNNSYIRVFKTVELPRGSTAPDIGDVMYSDLSYSEAKDYDGRKIPVGIVEKIAEDGKSVDIVGLRNLSFGNDFNPDNPYGD